MTDAAPEFVRPVDPPVSLPSSGPRLRPPPAGAGIWASGAGDEFRAQVFAPDLISSLSSDNLSTTYRPSRRSPPPLHHQPPRSIPAPSSPSFPEAFCFQQLPVHPTRYEKVPEQPAPTEIRPRHQFLRHQFMGTEPAPPHFSRLIKYCYNLRTDFRRLGVHLSWRPRIHHPPRVFRGALV